MSVRSVLPAAVLLALIGCGKPAQLGPDEAAFRSVDALYTAVTAKRPDLLDACEAKLSAHHDAGRLPPEAWASLKGIIDKARAGKWEPAAARLHDFMKGQERRGKAS